MKARSFSRRVGVFAMGLIFTGVVFQSAADSIEMHNGDRYVGTVVSIDAKHLRLRNENFGVLKIDRQKITTIHLGDPARPLAASAAPSTNTVVLVQKAATAMASEQTVVDQVRSQFLSAAGPEAEQLFSSTAQGVLNGTITVGEIRTQAGSAANEIRKLQKELGPEGDALDGYLSILDHFLSETRSIAPTAKASQIAR
jgi:hypothetical protein